MAMINFGTPLANYADTRYATLLKLEERGTPSLNVYTDSKGYATIGAGFLVSTCAEKILGQMYPLLASDKLLKARDAIKAATQGVNFGQGATGTTAALNAINTALRQATGDNSLNFTFTDSGQVRSTFDAIAVDLDRKSVV